MCAMEAIPTISNQTSQNTNCYITTQWYAEGLRMPRPNFSETPWLGVPPLPAPIAIFKILIFWLDARIHQSGGCPEHHHCKKFNRE